MRARCDSPVHMLERRCEAPNVESESSRSDVCEPLSRSKQDVFNKCASVAAVTQGSEVTIDPISSLCSNSPSDW